MAEVIGVRFRQVGKVYYFDPAGIQAQKTDCVIVETARGIECGEVAMENRQVDDESIVKPLKKVIRKATAEDLVQVRKNQTAGWISGSWSRIWRRSFGRGLSCGKLACGTKPRCWGDWASAGGRFAAPPF